MKIALNGFGRLGRSIARVILQTPNVKLVKINDIASWEILCYLFQRDSVHGQLQHEVQLQEGWLQIGDHKIELLNAKDSQELDFGEVDVVIEASGKFLSQEAIAHHLDKGARRVILSAPSVDDMPTFVLGVNHHGYSGEKIISNASCTTNAIAPICKILDDHIGIESGILTTIHSYTSDQNLLDNAHRSDKRRSRAAGINIIPTSTGSARALHRVLPRLREKMHGHSVRVPVADVSMIDLNIALSQNVQIDYIQHLFENYAQNKMKDILGIDDNYGVSSDFIGNPLSVILAKDLSFVLAGKHLKVMGWYDNEWGYANRIVEMAQWICE
ncbi:type I glyceraldehyde-3-phosphate dehydrogenase [Helicobacter kayseriensis]|uniref:type I glyceraldehyde-3-phosphate dehydrogenase n=1 Tax=Helicobacter kayseriensis TaxID=2905877 RepID=UPI001E5FC6C6|nr:type I glyceraldehyde-3-phosphate dehydrogenase [Helicobacter kayseriensis]MCE3047721.1 type I glyceraldehyde-3-phosphate dehydrogenase [Helicobacter kayseriensis]MCE3049041.1 type I glyceraldehyde-3-phosphate dehydrogenase [Helicobacter kayseriensis]